MEKYYKKKIIYWRFRKWYQCGPKTMSLPSFSLFFVGLAWVQYKYKCKTQYMRNRKYSTGVIMRLSCHLTAFTLSSLVEARTGDKPSLCLKEEASQVPPVRVRFKLFAIIADCGAVSPVVWLVGLPQNEKMSSCHLSIWVVECWYHLVQFITLLDF